MLLCKRNYFLQTIYDHLINQSIELKKPNISYLHKDNLFPFYSNSHTLHLCCNCYKKQIKSKLKNLLLPKLIIKLLYELIERRLFDKIILLDTLNEEKKDVMGYLKFLDTHIPIRIDKNSPKIYLFLNTCCNFKQLWKSGNVGKNEILKYLDLKKSKYF